MPTFYSKAMSEQAESGVYGGREFPNRARRCNRIQIELIETEWQGFSCDDHFTKDVLTMIDLFRSTPSNFVWATGIEDTFIPQARPGQRSLDEYRLMQHDKLWKSDLDLVADTGL